VIVHAWTVLCSRALIDKDTNNVSLLEVIEQIHVEDWRDRPGLAVLPLELASLWTRAEVDIPSRGEARTLFRNPMGDTMATQTNEVDLSVYKRLRNRGQLPALPIDRPGLHWFVIECRQQGSDEWREVSRLPLEVQVRTTADASKVTAP
jgi:hypothetical protein